MRNLSLVSVASVAVASAVRAFAPVTTILAGPRRRHLAPSIRPGWTNGYWITTTWGCYTDDGQGRIQDCEGGMGGGS